MQVVWDMLSDNKIWSLLGDTNREIDQDFIRLMLIELFSRLKTVEEENLALRLLLLEDDLIDRNCFNTYRQLVHDFIKQKEKQDEQESNFFAHSGISFPEWVNFKLSGRFDKT